jgi:hypothetical protein
VPKRPAEEELHQELVLPTDCLLELAQELLAPVLDFELVDPSDLHRPPVAHLCPEWVYPSGFVLHRAAEVVASAVRLLPVPVLRPNLWELQEHWKQVRQNPV